jgi:glycogen debranching enzyme
MKKRILPVAILLALLLLSVCRTPKQSRQLIWQSERFALYRDSVVQPPFVARVLSPTELVSTYQSLAKPAPATASRWKMSRPTAAFPRYQSDYPVVDALYNLALEEMVKAVEPDSTFRTGQEWAGVWTRDISYSILLSMAVLQPRVSRYSLLRKVKNGRIIQDTGTGGAYPVSSDRMVWALAAWELYKVTGQEDWLRQAYPIIKNSLEDDLKNIYDPRTSLFRGESSFLDWREQTYPAWMQPADIYESESLGTNAVFYQAAVILSAMASLLHDMPAAAKYHQLAVSIKQGINEQFWLPGKGYYGQYRYGRTFKILSPRAEALGEALAILFGITDIDRQKSLVEKTPVTAFGIPSIYPQIPNIPPYHNNGIWPFVQAYWSLATAKGGNEVALMESMSALYRPAALLLTNKENFVAATGDAAGTQINSSNMLWSLAGNLSLVYKVLFGLDFQPHSLVFKPVVPRALKGRRQLSNFRYRRALLDIEMTGYGNQIRSIRLDNQSLPGAAVPASLVGRHTVKIELADKELHTDKINKVAVAFSPATPVVTHAAGTLAWNRVPGAVAYQVLKNGKLLLRTQMRTVPLPAGEEYAEYQVIAEDGQGHESFANEPLIVAPAATRQIYELESGAPAPRAATGYSGRGYVAISRQQNTRLHLPVTVPEAAWYAIDFRYANGAGPINTSNKCALRALHNGPVFIGTIVMPQRGDQAWSDWGFTNAVQVKLSRGSHPLALTFEPANENMHGEVNEALLDYMRLTRIKSEAGPGSN